MKRLKFGDAVRVYWLDSAVNEGWHRATPTKTVGKIVSLGYVVESTPTVLTMSHSIEQTGPFLSTLSIPRAAIVEIERLDTLKR